MCEEAPINCGIRDHFSIKIFFIWLKTAAWLNSLTLITFLCTWSKFKHQPTRRLHKNMLRVGSISSTISGGRRVCMKMKMKFLLPFGKRDDDLWSRTKLLFGCEDGGKLIRTSSHFRKGSEFSKDWRLPNWHEKNEQNDARNEWIELKINGLIFF